MGVGVSPPVVGEEVPVLEPLAVRETVRVKLGVGDLEGELVLEPLAVRDTVLEGVKLGVGDSEPGQDDVLDTCVSTPELRVKPPLVAAGMK